ncbi:hypothetical protein CerSpe_018310 [Prunus speciosa]
MSVAVCGSKRSFFEELPPSLPLSKRLRCSSSTSPIRFSAPYLLDQLCFIFPQMDPQVLERALEECGNDIDAAVKMLHELHLGSGEENSASAAEQDEAVAAFENPSVPSNRPVDGAEWVELFIREMMSANSVNDARARAAKVLEVFGKSISARAGAEVAQSFQKENMLLKQQTERLIMENTILKRAVSIQHERQKEHDEWNQEFKNLKQLVSQYQEQLRTLEVNNYALTMHLKQAQQSNSIPGSFHPDVF